MGVGESWEDMPIRTPASPSRNRCGGRGCGRGNSAARSPSYFSLWNRYDFTPWLGVWARYITRSDMYTSVSNEVVLPGYTRLDAALYARLDRRLRFQVNVENMVNTHYFLTASNDQNISPGSPAAVRGTMVMDF